MRNATYNKLKHLYQKSEGYISTRELLEEGLTNRQIAALTDENYLEKVCHGHYWMAQSGYQKPADYKCIEVCLSSPEAVIAMESACYYQNMMKKEPEALDVATERTNRSAIKMNFPIKRRYFSENMFRCGIKKVRRKEGSYNIYVPERSLCDIVRLEGEEAGREFLMEIYEEEEERERQYERMLKYAELLKIPI